MKRIKITLLTVAIVLGISSAFATTVALPGQLIKLATNNYVDKDTYFGTHPTAQCVAKTASICTYIAKAGATLPYSDSEVQADTQNHQGINHLFLP